MATKRACSNCNINVLHVMNIIMIIIFTQGQGLEVGGAVVPAETSPDGKCQQDGVLISKTGYPNELENLSLVSIFLAPSKDDCHKACWESCSCSVQIIFSLENNTFACMSFNGTILSFQEDSDSKIEFSIPLRLLTPASPGPAQQSPSLAPSERGSNSTYARPHQPIRNAEGQWIWVLFVALGAVLSAMGVCFVALLCYFDAKRCRETIEFTEEVISSSILISKSSNKLEKHKKLGQEMQLFTFKCIYTATNQFSPSNKLGEGGFGPVYKGNLVGGQEVAVKRLSRSSSQGMFEFKNEINLIAKLQHTNFVSLLGYSAEGSEKMLVYEFLPNKSLDSFLFDPAKKKQLDWKKRLEIIGGTAQGLLYLHKYSRLKVIHRDLKTSNILLDSNLNPKISDFGLARIFEQNTSSASTNRIVGTYGYMSPEYAMEGLYSEKSDVFSFGVIVLEIMSGKKATSFLGIEDHLNLIRYSWDLWREGKSMELIDETIGETCGREELVRHIQVGLLCVEENASERPTMCDVVSMLTNGAMHLPVPRQPAFYHGKSENVLEINDSKKCSQNLVTLSPILGR